MGGKQTKEYFQQRWIKIRKRQLMLRKKWRDRFTPTIKSIYISIFIWDW